MKISELDYNYQIVIPARYASTRLPGKPLLRIAGKPLLQHVYEMATRCDASRVTIATDDERICQAAKAFGAETIMTAQTHHCGTERLAEVAQLQGAEDTEIIINLQGDELGIPPEWVQQVAKNLHQHPEYSIATLCHRIEDEADIHNPNVVKVVFNQNNTALYFSRATIPYNNHNDQKIEYFAHIGIYAYRVAYLKKFCCTPCLPVRTKRIFGTA